MRVYPKSYTSGVPEWLAPTMDPPSPDELEMATAIRRQFLFAGEGSPYMVDVVRAMRLLRGRRTYIEVGTYDKGCLAYFSKLLAADAHLVDVDIEARPERTTMLREFLTPAQRLTTVVGDSTRAETLAAVEAAVGLGRADAIFIDGNHTASFAMADYVNFERFLAPGGLLFFHDVYWEGDGQEYGVARAMEWIDRRHPVHVIFADHPVHRFLPWMTRSESVWGGVAVVRDEREVERTGR